MFRFHWGNAGSGAEIPAASAARRLLLVLHLDQMDVFAIDQ
jgi:hypothetical protein